MSTSELAPNYGRYAWKHVWAGADCSCFIDWGGKATCYVNTDPEKNANKGPANSLFAALGPAAPVPAHSFVSIGCGRIYCCGLVEEGGGSQGPTREGEDAGSRGQGARMARCWGYGKEFAFRPPTGGGLRSWVSVSVGREHSIGIVEEEGRTVRCWGRDMKYGRACDVPEGVSFVQVAASQHNYGSGGTSCGIAISGQGLCWGAVPIQIPADVRLQHLELTTAEAGGVACGILLDQTVRARSAPAYLGAGPSPSGAHSAPASF